MKPALRFWLLVPFAVALVFFTLDRAEAQRNIGGRPGGTITGRPPGGVTGMPGTGMPGPGTGLGGTNIGGPRPGGGAAGNLGGGFGGGAAGNLGGGGVPIIEKVWTCGKCGRELGRGNLRPTTTCACGLNYVNGTARDNAPGFLGGNGIGGPPPGGMNPGSGIVDQPPVMQPPITPPIMQPPMNQPPMSGNNLPSEVNSAAKSVSGGMIAAGITVILFGLVILGSVVFLVLNNGKDYSAPVRRRSRK